MEKETLERLIGNGHSSRKISEIMKISRGTVSYWIEKYGLKTKFNYSSKSISKYEWDKIQLYYNDGHSEEEVSEKFKVSASTILRAIRCGKFKSRTISESMKISCKKSPRKHTEETKEKISKIRKLFLINNPEKAPYLLNHYSRGPSYPETYFSDVFKKEGICLKRYYRFGTYQLDFADVDGKIDIEIDGSQHRYDKKIVSHDLKRNNFMALNGWKVFRIYWPEYQKKTYEERKKVIEEIKSILMD